MMIQIKLFHLGVVDGPDVRKLIKCEEFTNILEGNESIAWDCIKAVIETLLGKHRSPEYSIFLHNMLDSFHKLGISMTLKIHFLHQHLDRMVNQLSTESDEQGEKFHQTIAPIESRYKGKKLDSMLGDLCWWSQNVYKYKQLNSNEIDEDDIIYESDDSN